MAMKYRYSLSVIATTAMTLGLLTTPLIEAEASYAIYIGKNLTEDGSVLIGGSGDEVSSHWLEIVPAREFPAGTTIKVGVDASANMPGQYIEIPQATQTHRYLTMNYSDYEGFPPPITNGGLNEHNVAGRDVWSDSRPELVAMTPNPQTGPSYSDLSRIAMERATSAREAVEIVGSLIDEYGYSTYGGNSHMFADENEGWVLLNFAGGQGCGLRSDSVPMIFACHIQVTSETYPWIFATAPTLWDLKISLTSPCSKDGSIQSRVKHST